MSDINTVTLSGRLGRDPEIRASTNGLVIARASVAVSGYAQGGERTDWVNVVAFGKVAEVMEKYVKKGSRIGITGRVQTRQWKDRDGKNHYSTEVVADRLVLFDAKDAAATPPPPLEEPPQANGEPPAEPPIESAVDGVDTPF